MKYWKEILMLIVIVLVIAFCLFSLKVSIDNSVKLDHAISILEEWTLEK